MIYHGYVMAQTGPKTANTAAYGCVGHWRGAAGLLFHCLLIYLNMQTIHFNIYFSIQLINSFSTIYKNFKMINITYVISILNFIFTIVFYVEMNKIGSHLHMF
jgi:hypothetical protein